MTADPRLHYRNPLRHTPFHPRTATHNRLNQWGPWAGFTTALVYEDEAMEYTAIRNAASVYDLCPMVKYRITGPDAPAYLNRLTVRNAEKLSVGGVHYTVWCDDAGRILDDGTLFRLGKTDYRICCQERHLPWLLDSAFGYDVNIAEETDDIAALSLQGPCTAAVLDAAGFPVWDLKPFRMASFDFAGGRLTVSRTGFTGDLGYELWTTPDLALPLWDHLFAAGARWGIRPIGTNALNLARIEAGFIITNMDFIPADQAVREDRSRSPLELGLDWMIDWDKGHFTGRRALLAERDGNLSRWALVGLDIEGNVSAEGSLLYHNKKTEAGFITAAAWSPTTKRNLALAHVERKHLKGENLWVEIYALRELQYVKLMLPVRVVERPFFNPARKRATPPREVLMTEHRPPQSPLLDHCPQTLPAAAYLDRGWHDRELATIFARNWVCAGRLADLAPGTMRPVQVGAASVILCRAADGGVSAFHNTCRHRGAEICRAEAALGKLISCPYHAWAYAASDGRLVSVAHATPTPDFRKEDHGLHPVSTRIWAGFVFLNLDPDPRPLAPDTGLAFLDNWPMDSLITGHRHVRDLACNWKVFWENYNECLHCPGIHPELCDMVPIYGRGIMAANEAPDWTPGTASGPNLKPGAESWTMTGAPCGPVFPGLTPEERQNGYNFATVYPTLYIVAHVDYVRSVRLEPLGPELTRLTAEWHFPAETLAQPGFDAAGVAAFAKIVLDQDGDAAEMNQRGIRSPAYGSGRLMPQEFDIARFHAWVRAEMEQGQ